MFTPNEILHLAVNKKLEFFKKYVCSDGNELYVSPNGIVHLSKTFVCSDKLFWREKPSMFPYAKY